MKEINTRRQSGVECDSKARKKSKRDETRLIADRKDGEKVGKKVLQKEDDA